MMDDNIVIVKIGERSAAHGKYTLARKEGGRWFVRVSLILNGRTWDCFAYTAQGAADLAAAQNGNVLAEQFESYIAAEAARNTELRLGDPRTRVERRRAELNKDHANGKE